MLGKVLVVGGGASVAPEIVSVFAEGSEEVWVTYRSVPFRDKPSNVNDVACDLDRESDRTGLRDHISASGRGLDAAVFLTGAILGKNLENTSDDEMIRLSQANLIGPASLIRDLLPVFNQGARLLIVSSISGQRGSFDPIYAATKGALLPFAKSLATWHGEKFTTTVIAPGAIEESSMVSDMSAERIAFHRNASPTKRLLTRLDLAQVVFDLAHPHWGHSNGAVINLNGGTYV